MLFKTAVSGSNIIISRSISRLASNGYLHNPGSEPLTYATIGQVVEASADRWPGRVAVKSLYEDVTFTYEQLLTKADSLGCSLRAQGLEKGDMVGIWSHNNSQFIVTLVGAARAGLISVLLNPLYEKPELSFCIKKTGLKAIVIGDTVKRDYFKTIEQLIPEVHQYTPGNIVSQTFPSLKSIISCDKKALPGTFCFDSLVASKEDASRFCTEVEPDNGAIIHLTSGTTGDPKAALDAHFGYINNSYFVGKRQKLHEEHHTVCVQAPLFHAMGSVITTGAALRHGATLVLAAPIYNPDMNLKALINERCTILNGTPTMFVDLVNLVRGSGNAKPNLRVALNGGAPCSPQLVKDVKKYLNADMVTSLFGLSETTAAVFQNLPDDSTELVANTVGYIHDHVEARVVDDDGKTLPFGSPGELLVRGYCNMIGYWGEPKKTRETLREDGWLYTGDKFILGEDGYGRIVGRLKDIIVRGGENIAPKEIEDLLNTHPDIIESQVVGVSDERLGEELCAVVRLRAGAAFGADALRRHLDGRLAKFKIPRLLRVVEQFPKTNSGKIQKFKIRDMIESGKL